MPSKTKGWQVAQIVESYTVAHHDLRPAASVKEKVIDGIVSIEKGWHRRLISFEE